MCTAISVTGRNFMFGRTLDYHRSYGEQVVITPRNYPFTFRHAGSVAQHAAMLGAAINCEFPLYYDAMNEHGLCMAGLNFPHSARYFPVAEGRLNLAQFELIPYVLAICKSADEAAELLGRVNVTHESYSPQLPAAPLHWLVADGSRAFVAESTAGGMNIFDDPAGVLTNEPPFGHQMQGLANYMHLSPRQPQNAFSPGIKLEPHGMGFGAIGLPGDASPQSRFVRAAFFAGNFSGDLPEFFNVLGALSVPRGSCITDEGEEATIYSCCCMPCCGTYFYRTERSLCVCRVDLFAEDLSSALPVAYPMHTLHTVAVNSRKE